MNYTRLDSIEDQYPQFSLNIKNQFSEYRNKPLFTTNAEGLFEAYLDNLPEEARQHYNCRCCRQFIERFGGLVHIGEDGQITSVMWDEFDMPKFFLKAVKAMKRIVLKARVTGVFLSGEQTLGTPASNGWNHMSVSLPRDKVFNSRIKTAGQEMAEKREDFRTLIGALVTYDKHVVDKAVTLLESESLYRSDRFLGVAKFAQELHVNRAKAEYNTAKENVVWLAVATAPSGFTHIKSSMIGTLLDDIVDGYSSESIARRFREKMGTYQVAQSAPSVGNIAQAERLVEQLGIKESLERRYAIYEEIPEFIWQDKEPEKKSSKSGGVFGNIAPKQSRGMSPATNMELQSTVMTWDKFQRTVLPTAESLEVMVNNPNRLMALVTAANPQAPNILQWENPFSWYYHGGIDGEIKRRVESAGGQYENNEIRVSLIWEGYTDLDLHCITPSGKHILFNSKRADGGYLDIDANGIDGKTATPVENMRWTHGQAKEGKYRFFVHNYSQHGNAYSTPFKVELEVNGKIYTTSGSLGYKNQMDVFNFTYAKGQHPVIRNSVGHESSESWGVFQNSFVKVKGITNSPNQWGERKAEHVGHHIFFLLEDAKDESQGKGRGFFVETLKPELREVRKTLEAYTANTPIEGVEESSACGVGFSKDSEWDVVVKVTTDNSTRLIKIDRWD